MQRETAEFRGEAQNSAGIECSGAFTTGCYTQPWTLELPLRRDMSYTIYEYACHEGNRAVTGILGGARHVELHGDGAGR